MSGMLLTTVMRIDLGIHEVIILISVFRDEWLLELLVDLRLIVNRSWFWGKTFWMSSVLLSAIMWVNFKCEVNLLLWDINHLNWSMMVVVSSLGGTKEGNK